MTSMPRSRRIGPGAKCALLVLGLLAIGPGFARSSDREQPMQVNAQHFDGFQKPNSTSTLTGKVSITQGTLKATGSVAKVHFDGDSQINRVVITGSPAHIQQLDDNGNLMTGAADSIDYNNIKQIAVLSGHATVKQKGRGAASGDTLTYNTQTSQMTGESNGDGLVHMTFQPKPKPAAAKSPAPAKGQP
ncbi:MAG: lipopolysaccharide transport periplasmic protein LptA [Rhodanobacter sp.]|nr:MAG: lipopolysaccharide transport periplasmic protein LptA [Rhodanobacter sp.]